MRITQEFTSQQMSTLLTVSHLISNLLTPDIGYLKLKNRKFITTYLYFISLRLIACIFNN